jgi:dTMP kinase
VNLPHQFPGFLIAIEGIDGAGKTNQVEFLRDHFIAKNLSVIRTKEPTAGQWGQLLRDSAVTGRLSLDEEVETFIKDRKEHVETVIIPALREGKIVIVDRYYFSTMAYQGARGISPEELMRRNEMFAPEPDLLVLLDIDPNVGLERIRNRGDRANYFENSGTLEKAREIFNRVQKPYLCRLDGTLAPELVRDAIVGEFSKIYAARMAQSTSELRKQPSQG